MTEADKEMLDELACMALSIVTDHTTRTLAKLEAADAMLAISIITARVLEGVHHGQPEEKLEHGIELFTKTVREMIAQIQSQRRQGQHH